MKIRYLNTSALSTISAIVALTTALTVSGGASAQTAKYSKDSTSDATLVKSLPGFRNATAEVNGLKLHYVIGGKGEPLVLLSGWPETWWSFHKIMPTLAQHYTVIVVDYRGMGSSSRPADGYDKKTMAGDLEQLVSQLGYKKVNIAGHDIGSQLAYAFAANYPASTSKVVMMDIPHSDESLLSWPLLPAHNTFGDKLDPAHPYPWWFAFHQVKGLPEKLLEGRAGLEHDWIFKYLTKHEDAITPLDRAVYARAYNSADAIRAGNAWYQSFTQDIIDDKAYARLQMPVLGIGGASSGFEWLKAVMSQKAVNFTPLKLDSGHFLPEEQPEAVASAIIDFLGKGD